METWQCIFMLGALPLPSVGTVGYFKQAKKIYALVSPFVKMNKFDLHRYTHVNIVGTPKVFGYAALVQARFSRKQAWRVLGNVLEVNNVEGTDQRGLDTELSYAIGSSEVGMVL